VHGALIRRCVAAVDLGPTFPLLPITVVGYSVNIQGFAPARITSLLEQRQNGI
jgi:hypothetical protein